MERVAVYIDGANFYYGLRSINERYTDTKFDFEKFINQIVRERELVDKRYYNASLKQQINPETFKKQQGLFTRLTKADFKVVLGRRQKRTSVDGSNYFTVKEDDILLAITMLGDAYEKKYDTAILISGDGDFAPLVKKVRSLGKNVENYYFAKTISINLLKVCTTSSVINKKTVNKFFYREHNN